LETENGESQEQEIKLEVTGEVSGILVWEVVKKKGRLETSALKLCVI
jgi:hypothetical protein